MSKRCFAADTLQPGACLRDGREPFRELARSLKSAGITTVMGDLIGDGSWFEPLLTHPAWEVYDLNWWYAAPVSALGVQDNSIMLVHAAGPSLGEPAVISVEPEVTGLVLENRTTTVGDSEPETLDYFRIPGTLTIVAEGTVRRSARLTRQQFALPDPNYFAAEVLRQVLLEEGITVAGSVRSTTDSLETTRIRRSKPLAEFTSRPIEDWIFPVLNSSQNWFAEMLLKQLGKQLAGEGSWRAGATVVRRFLIDSVGIDSTEFRIVDGSGLSAQNLVTPGALTRLLVWMRRHPRFAVFAQGLPVSGQAGSLAGRYTGTALEGRVRAKTGTISGVNSLSGYLEIPGREPLVFSIIANHHALSSAAVMRQIDRIVERMSRK